MDTARDHGDFFAGLEVYAVRGGGSRLFLRMKLGLGVVDQRMLAKLFDLRRSRHPVRRPCRKHRTRHGFDRVRKTYSLARKHDAICPFFALTSPFSEASWPVSALQKAFVIVFVFSSCCSCPSSPDRFGHGLTGEQHHRPPAKLFIRNRLLCRA
jgi:hypothetical protein